MTDHIYELCLCLLILRYLSSLKDKNVCFQSVCIFQAILIPLDVDFWKGFKDVKISHISFQIFLKYYQKSVILI